MDEAGSISLLLARVLMSGVFLFSAMEKLRRNEVEMQAIVGLHLPYPNLIATAAGVCEVLGSLMLIFGVGARVAAVLLGLFLFGVTVAFVHFWKAPTPEVRFGQTNAFFGNFGLMGGLIYVAVVGPGSFALFPHI